MDQTSSDTKARCEKPIRATPLPLEFPGVHHMDRAEVDAAVRVLESKSLFRYYGLDLQREAENLEAEMARYTGAKYALAVSSGTAALSVALAAMGYAESRNK